MHISDRCRIFSWRFLSCTVFNLSTSELIFSALFKVTKHVCSWPRSIKIVSIHSVLLNSIAINACISILLDEDHKLPVWALKRKKKKKAELFFLLSIYLPAHTGHISTKPHVQSGSQPGCSYRMVWFPGPKHKGFAPHRGGWESLGKKQGASCLARGMKHHLGRHP